MYYALLPFSLLLKGLYVVFSNYGLAIIAFALIVKLVLFPLNLKGKRSMIQMNLMNGKLQQLQKQYGKDRQRYQMEVQKFYQQEHINPMGGCVWNLIPMVILFALYYVIREPLTYMMHVTKDMIDVAATAAGVTESGAYFQIQIAQAMSDSSVFQAVQSALTAAGDTVSNLFVLNYNSFGLDLSTMPEWKFWAVGTFTWAFIGKFMIPLVSAATGFIASWISMKTNKLNNQPSNEKTARQTDMMQKQMLIMMPLMSLWIGYIMPAGLGIYWIANNVLMMIQELICGRILRQDYERAAVARAEQERMAKEEDKRLREEKAARKAQEIEEAKEARRRGIAARQQSQQQPLQTKGEKKTPINTSGRVGIRTYARGRSYDGNRYPITEYRDPDAKPIPETPVSAPEKAAEPAPEKIIEQTAPAAETSAPEAEQNIAAPAENAAAPAETGETDSEKKEQ